MKNNFDWGITKPSIIPMEDLIIYEMHVRGFTKDASSGVAHPGTFHGIMEKIPYLKELGINAVELMPIFEFDEMRDHRVIDGRELLDYWGYNTVSFFAPNTSYASDREYNHVGTELKQLIKTLKENGIEVILDVVFNHTAEGNEDGPFFSFKGIDNNVYYMLTPDGNYYNFSGCGNTVNCNHPVVQQMIVECLRYWVTTYRVDGFRFDLASVMGRTPAFRQDAPLFTAIQNCPQLSRVKLIAEPWDIGEGGYQVGNFPPPFAEWNDHFRDATRRFWLQRNLSLGEFAGRFAASSDVFKRNGRKPSATVNLVTAHDGFTLRDCVCFTNKHNEANGEENRDGTSNNYSDNHGKEGLGGTLDLIERRRDSIHALLTTLLLSQGTPMLLAGDEHGHSQHGNNNAYCQDNVLTWLDWQQANSGLTTFTAALIHLRQQIPALTGDRWWEEGDGNVRWLNKYAQPLSADEWQNGPRQMQILLSDRFLIAINATLEVTDIVLPEGGWCAVPPFAGEDNPVLTAVWQGPAHGLCVFQRR